MKTLLVLMVWLFPLLARAQDTAAELDGFWTSAARTVAEGDFDSYAATYHPDAVLVSLESGNSYPIAGALAGWRQGFDDTKAGKATAGVEFRFSQRLRDASTAHYTGIFHYWFAPKDGERTDSYVHFEGLLIKKTGEWKMVMEYQKQPATAQVWAAAEG